MNQARARRRRAAAGCVAAALLATVTACSSSASGNTSPGASSSEPSEPSRPAVPPPARGSSPGSAAPAADISKLPGIQIVANENMTFDVPAAVPAGAVVIQLMNADEDMPHEADLFLLHPGVTMAQFKHALLSPGGPAATTGIADPAGGSAAIGPGLDSFAAVELEPSSTYAVICQIPAPDGRPHYAHGMIADFRTDAGPGAAMPTGGNSVTMQNMSYDVPATIDWSQPITVVNRGNQPHQMQIIGAAPGKTLTDVTDYLKAPPGREPAGPPPYVAEGGAAPIAPGGTEIVDFARAPLAPGTYLLACFVVDPKTQMPHLAMGMLATVTVA